MIRLLYVLYQLGLLAPSALFRLCHAIRSHGANLMALLRFAAATYGDRIALDDERETLTYEQLYTQSASLSVLLREHYGMEGGKKTGIVCRNHASFVRTIFAAASTGSDLYLLHADMSNSQLQAIMEDLELDLLIYDKACAEKVSRTTLTEAALLNCETVPETDSLHVSEAFRYMLPRTPSGKLVLLTGGTAGQPKKAAHQPSLFNYLNPFAAFVTRLNIMRCQTAYIATPITHGYGVAVMLLMFALGRKVLLRRRFEAEAACRLVREHQVDVVTVVPLMLHKMLSTNPEDLKSLACIASGSAELGPKLATETQRRLGNVLYNLYGTSETGLNTIALPEDLLHDVRTIGKKIKGVRIKVLDEHRQEVETGRVGQIFVRNSWSIRAAQWIATGDLGYEDEQGYYYLRGRADDMIVSAGENVYPLETEQVLLAHPQVEDAAVIGVSDEVFGQRLSAYVVPAISAEAASLQEELREWLRARLARYQMPRDIVFVEHVPYTPLGKPDKKLLAKRQQ